MVLVTQSHKDTGRLGGHILNTGEMGGLSISYTTKCAIWFESLALVRQYSKYFRIRKSQLLLSFMD